MRRYFAVLFLILLWGCVSEGRSVEQDIVGEWRLEQYHSGRGAVIDIPVGELYLYRFGGNGALEVAGAVCNSCKGDYAVGEDRSFAASVSCTEAACDGLHVYGHALNSARDFNISGDTLVISFEDAGELGVLRLRRVRSPTP